ncbi:hypothetical protein PPTG_09810 [Phytophthora nicotianae INRA-310]|uniref:Uncharacterized protein n=1 Tax=Phytophthora nicotianae (strain INRA-310) TaxID=761204 RepID=W2QCW8_PHYN3|nr:hypothetical protein PPTG_09810 [Phytophthora nicotianae INRA-310]ETN10716.1 hypothetical protein PPTG_09810 [Phytophthora nicotianae INRA-310]
MPAAWWTGLLRLMKAATVNPASTLLQRTATAAVRIFRTDLVAVAA